MKVKLTTFDDIKRFQQLLSHYESEFMLKHGHYCVDASSLLGILSLDLSKPCELIIIEHNEGEEEEVKELIKKLNVVVEE